jgi:hypothetical protein
MPATQSYEPVFIAAIHHPPFTRATISVIDRRLHAYPIAHLDILDFITDFFNNPTKLMSKGKRECFTGDRVRMVGFGDQVRAAEVLVQVGAADAAEFRGDFDVMGGGEGRDGDLLEADVALAVEADCVH